MKLKNHNLSLKGISGIFTGVLSLLFIWIIQLLLLDFSSGSQGIGILPISIFEIILGVISLVYILLTYFMVAIINKRRRKKNQLDIEVSGLDALCEFRIVSKNFEIYKKL